MTYNSLKQENREIIINEILKQENEMRNFNSAMKVLKKRAEFYGTTTEQLSQWIDNGLDESSKVLQAHRIVNPSQITSSCWIM